MNIVEIAKLDCCEKDVEGFGLSASHNYAPSTEMLESMAKTEIDQVLKKRIQDGSSYAKFAALSILDLRKREL